MKTRRLVLSALVGLAAAAGPAVAQTYYINGYPQQYISPNAGATQMYPWGSYPQAVPYTYYTPRPQVQQYYYNPPQQQYYQVPQQQYYTPRYYTPYQPPQVQYYNPWYGYRRWTHGALDQKQLLLHCRSCLFYFAPCTTKPTSHE